MKHTSGPPKNFVSSHTLVISHLYDDVGFLKQSGKTNHILRRMGFPNHGFPEMQRIAVMQLIKFAFQ